MIASSEIRLIMRPSVATIPLTKSFAICEATSGVGWMRSWLIVRISDTPRPKGDHLIADLDDQNGVAGRRFGRREAEPRREVDNRQHRPTQVDDATDKTRRMSNRRRRCPAANFPNQHDIDAEFLDPNQESDHFARRGAIRFINLSHLRPPVLPAPSSGPITST